MTSTDRSGTPTTSWLGTTRTKWISRT